LEKIKQDHIEYIRSIDPEYVPTITEIEFSRNLSVLEEKIKKLEKKNENLRDENTNLRVKIATLNAKIRPRNIFSWFRTLLGIFLGVSLTLCFSEEKSLKEIGEILSIIFVILFISVCVIPFLIDSKIKGEKDEQE